MCARIISFAWTSRALVAGHKTVTRRDWSLNHAVRFHAADVVHAWDHNPRTGKGHHIATISLIESPFEERPGTAPDGDYDREGFRYLSRYPGDDDEERARTMKLTAPAAWWDWKEGAADKVTVIRFRLESVTPAGIALLSHEELAELAGRLAMMPPATARRLPLNALRAMVSAQAIEVRRVADALGDPALLANEVTQ